MLADSIKIFFRNIKSFLIFILPIITVNAVTGVVLDGLDYLSIFISSVLSFIISVIIYPSMIFYIQTLVLEQPNIKESFIKGRKKILLYSLFSIFIILLLSAGLVVLIIPGIIFAVRFSLASYYLVLEEQDVVDAMRSSWEETGDDFWLLLFGGATIYGVSILTSSAPSIFGIELFVDSFIFDLLNNFISTSAVIISHIFFYLFYKQNKDSTVIIEPEGIHL